MSRVNVENCVRDSANPAYAAARATCPRSTRSSWTGSSRSHGPHHPEEASAEVADRDGRRLQGRSFIHRPPAPTSPAPAATVVDIKTRHLIPIANQYALRPYRKSGAAGRGF